MSIDEISTDFRRQRRWPVSAKEDVFLIAALLEVGKAIYGTEWTGNEINWKLLESYGLTSEQKARREVALRKFMIAAKIMHHALLNGLLECRHRPRGGKGELAPTPAAWWNNDEWHSRFQFGTINSRDPMAEVSYDEARDHSHRTYLFVTRTSLDAILAKLGPKIPEPAAPWEQVSPAALGPSPVPDQYLSPYLRLMMAVSARMAIRPDNQPRKKLVVAALEDEAAKSSWPYPLSGNQLDYMATLIRDPDSQSGRAKQGGTLKQESGKK